MRQIGKTSAFIQQTITIESSLSRLNAKCSSEPIKSFDSQSSAAVQLVSTWLRCCSRQSRIVAWTYLIGIRIRMGWFARELRQIIRRWRRFKTISSKYSKITKIGANSLAMFGSVKSIKRMQTMSSHKIMQRMVEVLVSMILEISTQQLSLLTVPLRTGH